MAFNKRNNNPIFKGELYIQNNYTMQYLEVPDFAIKIPLSTLSGEKINIKAGKSVFFCQKIYYSLRRGRRTKSYVKKSKLDLHSGNYRSVNKIYRSLRVNGLIQMHSKTLTFIHLWKMSFQLIHKMAKQRPFVKSRYFGTECKCKYKKYIKSSRWKQLNVKICWIAVIKSNKGDQIFICCRKTLVQIKRI